MKFIIIWIPLQCLVMQSGIMFTQIDFPVVYFGAYTLVCISLIVLLLLAMHLTITTHFLLFYNSLLTQMTIILCIILDSIWLLIWKLYIVIYYASRPLLVAILSSPKPHVVILLLFDSSININMSFSVNFC